MSQSMYRKQIQPTKIMTEQQFEEIVDAILGGKYSWACVLILRTAGYNPLHYIPYRTYNRLIKDNCLNKPEKSYSKNSVKNSAKSTTQSGHGLSKKCGKKIKDLNYLDSIDDKQTKVVGGFRIQWSLF